MRKIDYGFLRKLWKLIRIYWASKEKWPARGLLAVTVSLNLGHIYVLVLLNEWNKQFYNSLQERNSTEFFSLLVNFSVLVAIFILVVAYEVYLQQKLEIKWRRFLTAHFIRDWLTEQAYYRLQLSTNCSDNPDQRISDDLRLFVSITLNLSLGLLRSIVSLLSFGVILWGLSGNLPIPLGEGHIIIPGYLVWISVLFSIAGTWIASKIGNPLVGLDFDQQRYEADFRFSLVRLRENSEGVAFYGGEKQEEVTFSKQFKMVLDNFREIISRKKTLTAFMSGYAQWGVIFPFLVAAPLYFSNQIQLGGLIQITYSFGRVEKGLSFFVDNYASFAEWLAVINRLTGFVDNMAQVSELPKKKAFKTTYSDDSLFTVKDLNINLPNGETILHQLDLQINAGDSLLITGPSGCGKSTLLRTLAGIWPFGHGNISRPRNQKVLFIPQKSYLPLGTLRDVLLYPYGAGSRSEETIIQSMNDCKLCCFVNSLDTIGNWSLVLSLGEQQRVAFARALLQRPEWLFLDEATSALDEPTEQLMYGLLKERLKSSAIISVGHRSTLFGYHKTKLNLERDGRWRLLA